MADPLSFSPLLTNPRLPDLGTPTPVKWTVSGGTPPYTWSILKTHSDVPFPIDRSPIVLTGNETANPGNEGVTKLEVETTTTRVYAWATGNLGWVDVRVTDGNKNHISQSVWIGEILLYAPDGNLWVAPSSAWTIMSPRPPHIPTREVPHGSHIWGIAWAPQSQNTKNTAELGASLTCYILNHDALHAARLMTYQDSDHLSITYPLMVPVVWVPPTEDDK